MGTGAALCSALSPAREGHMRLLKRYLQLDDGQDLLEYAMLAALIAVAAIGAVTVLGDHIKTVFWDAIGPSI
jgi:Flp pilus assembly pilin Flp